MEPNLPEANPDITKWEYHLSPDYKDGLCNLAVSAHGSLGKNMKIVIHLLCCYIQTPKGLRPWSCGLTWMLDIGWERVFSLWANYPQFHDPSLTIKPLNGKEQLEANSVQGYSGPSNYWWSDFWTMLKSPVQCMLRVCEIAFQTPNGPCKDNIVWKPKALH